MGRNPQSVQHLPAASAITPKIGETPTESNATLIPKAGYQIQRYRAKRVGMKQQRARKQKCAAIFLRTPA